LEKGGSAKSPAPETTRVETTRKERRLGLSGGRARHQVGREVHTKKGVFLKKGERGGSSKENTPKRDRRDFG